MKGWHGLEKKVAVLLLLTLRAGEVSQAAYPQSPSLRRNPILGQAAWVAVAPGWMARSTRQKMVPSSD